MKKNKRPLNEFQLIQTFFTPLTYQRPEVALGIGDDCAILHIPPEQALCISTDTLVSGVHFLPDWHPEDIAYKAVMVNLSDCAAMAADPFAMTLAITLPNVDEAWLKRFSIGLNEALQCHQVELIGGDTTKGPLSMTLTVLGKAPKNNTIQRSGAKIHDRIYVSGDLGLSAFAVWLFESLETRTHALSAERERYHALDQSTVFTHPQDMLCQMKRALHFPTPRLDLIPILRSFASAAIDISDGLLADLNHLCVQSRVGAHLQLDHVPVHPILQQYTTNGLDFSLHGGDDYELCFTIPEAKEKQFLETMRSKHLSCYCIGTIEADGQIQGEGATQPLHPLDLGGYVHF